MIGAANYSKPAASVARRKALVEKSVKDLLTLPSWCVETIDSTLRNSEHVPSWDYLSVVEILASNSSATTLGFNLYQQQA